MLVSRALPYPRELLFDVAADIESYPEFLFWCRQARILERNGDQLTVENHFGIGPFQARFLTRALFDPPRLIEVTSTDPPFHILRVLWRFEPEEDGKTRVSLEIRQELRNPLFQAAAAPFMAGAEEAAIQAFTVRARKVHQSSRMET